MNLIQQAEHLKNLPDQALAQMQQNPQSVPPWLVMTEMQRRESMRKSYQATQGDPVQERTVAEEMRDKFNPAAPPMPQGGLQGQQPMPGAPPMRMAGGGLASLQGYFDQMQGANPLPEVDPSIGYPQFPGAPPMGTFADEPAMNRDQLNSRYGAEPSIEEVMQVVRSLRGKSRLEGIADELAAQEKGYRNKKPKLGETLMQLGLGMAASKRPDFAGAVGEGGLAALHGYQQQREMNSGRADATMKQRMGIAEAMQQSDDVATREAGELHRANMAGRNTAIMTGENARQGMQGQKSRERINDATRASQAEIEAMREAAAERRYQETGRMTSEEKQKDREARAAELEREIAAGKYRDHSSGAGEKPSALLAASLRMLPGIESEILHLQTAYNNTLDKGEQEAIKARLTELRKKKDAWSKVQIAEIKRTMPNADMSALDEQQEVTPEQLLQMFPPRGDKPAATAVDRAEQRKKAGTAMMNNMPGLQSIMSAAAALARK